MINDPQYYAIDCGDHMELSMHPRGTWRRLPIPLWPGEVGCAARGWRVFDRDNPPDNDCIVYEAGSGRVYPCLGSEWEASGWRVTHWMPLEVALKE